MFNSNSTGDIGQASTDQFAFNVSSSTDLFGCNDAASSFNSPFDPSEDDDDVWEFWKSFGPIACVSDDIQMGGESENFSDKIPAGGWRGGESENFSDKIPAGGWRSGEDTSFPDHLINNGGGRASYLSKPKYVRGGESENFSDKIPAGGWRNDNQTIDASASIVPSLKTR